MTVTQKLRALRTELNLTQERWIMTYKKKSRRGCCSITRRQNKLLHAQYKGRKANCQDGENID